MKNLIYILFIVVVFTTTGYAQNLQWKQFLNSNNITSSASEGEYTWLGTTNGLVKLNNTTEEVFVYNNYNSGLPMNSITSVAVDSLGNKWIGVEYNGLVKFDNVNWIVYDDQNSGLPTKDIKSLVVDRAGNIWIGTYLQGLVKFDGINWTVFNTSNSGIRCTNIWAITIDNEGSVWFGGSTGDENVPINSMLGKYDGTNWTEYNNANSGIPRYPITSIIIDKFGVKWIGTRGSGLVQFDGLNTVIINDWGSYIAALAFDAIGNKWIGTYTGVFKVTGNTWTQYYSGFHITTIINDNNGNVLVGIGNGLRKYNGSGWTGIKISNSGLPNNIVTSVAFDSLNNKWIGTWNGVAKYDDENWTLYQTGSSGLPSNYINTIVVDNEDNKWIGTGTLGCAKLSGNNWQVFNSSNSAIRYDGKAIVIDKDNIKWIVGTHALYKYNDINWISYTYGNSGLPAATLSEITIDQDNNKWISTSAGGLVKFDGVFWTIFNTSNSGLPENDLTSIAIDKYGNKWIGTKSSGLIKYDGTNWTVYNTLNSSLWSNYINCISIDENNTLWIGTNGTGLTKFDGTNWKTYYTGNSGLPDNRVLAIEFDKLGNMWVGTANGLCVYNEGGIVNVEETTIKPIPNNFVLNQNYPNPFNPNTTISFSLPQSEKVTIKVYDILGKEIETLVNEELSAGVYNKIFNAENLSSGIYFYQLQAGKFSETKKMLLLK